MALLFVYQFKRNQVLVGKGIAFFDGRSDFFPIPADLEVGCQLMAILVEAVDIIHRPLVAPVILFFGFPPQGATVYLGIDEADGVVFGHILIAAHPVEKAPRNARSFA